jgi:methionine sulfoxide reductase heme-binding subunit
MQQFTSAASLAGLRQLSIITVRRVIKPIVFVICLIPLLIAIARIFGLFEGYIGGLGANPVESLMDHLGQWGLRFILIALTVSPLQKLMRIVWLGQFRRMLGLFAFTYVLSHFLVYLLLDQGLALDYIIEDVIERPFITLGMISLTLLTAMAVTSTNGMRRRLKANWQRIHYGAYLVAILGVWHYWWQVKLDITEPAVYALIAFLLLGSRIAFKISQKRKRQVSAKDLNG